MKLKISLRQRLRILSWILFSTKWAKVIFDSKTSIRLLNYASLISAFLAVMTTVIVIYGILIRDLLISVSAASFSALLYYMLYTDYLKARQERSRLIDQI